jgi:retinol dehydrogenase-14
LLTDLLLDLMKSSAPARIINVASAAHKVAGLDLNDLQMKSNYRGFLAYCNSKLENIMFTYELDRRLRGSEVTANCFHPGGIATDLYRDQSGLVKFLTRLFLRGPDQGARSGIYLAKSAEINGVSGKYYVGKNPARSSKQSYDTAAQQQLWDKSAELLGVSAS